MSTTIYGVGSHCGVLAGEEIGTIANHQLVLHVNRALTLEESIQRFALLPDDYVVRDDEGAHFSIGQLRRRLRDSARKNENHPGATLAISGKWPNLPDGLSGLLPLDAMDCAEACLARVISKRGSTPPLTIASRSLRDLQNTDHMRVVIFTGTGYNSGDPVAHSARCVVYLERGQLGWSACEVRINIGEVSELWRAYPNNHFEKE